MKSETVDLTKVVDALEGLRRELGRLGERVAALEAAAASPASRGRNGPERGRRPRLPGSPRRQPPLNRPSRRGSTKSSSW